MSRSSSSSMSMYGSGGGMEQLVSSSAHMPSLDASPPFSAHVIPNRSMMASDKTAFRSSVRTSTADIINVDEVTHHVDYQNNNYSAHNYTTHSQPRHPHQQHSSQADTNLNWRRRPDSNNSSSHPISIVPPSNHHQQNGSHRNNLALNKVPLRPQQVFGFTPSTTVSKNTNNAPSTDIRIKPANINTTAPAPGTSVSSLSSALVLSKNLRTVSVQVEPKPGSGIVSEPVSPSDIDDTQELLGRVGHHSTASAFVVRSRTDGSISIFKPADGEGYLEQGQESEPGLMLGGKKKKTAITGQFFSGSLSSSLASPQPTSPLSPDLSSSSASESSMSLVHPLIPSVAPPKTPLKRGIDYGEGALKEEAVFLLDAADNFSSVPKTRTTTLLIPKDLSSLPSIDPTSIIATNQLTYREKELIEKGSASLSASSAAAIVVPSDSMVIPRSRPVSIGTASANRSPAGTSRRHAVIDDDDTHHDKEEEEEEECVPLFGSLSAFVPHISSAEDFGSSSFSTADVHRIAILDIRILNLDRHLANILVSRDQHGLHLIPIDHSYSLPSYKELRDVRFEWTEWKQCEIPFSASELAYIRALDPVADVRKLQKLGIKQESFISLIFSTLLLQRGAEAGLTVKQIAQMVQRQKKIRVDSRRRGNREHMNKVDHEDEDYVYVMGPLDQDEEHDDRDDQTLDDEEPVSDEDGEPSVLERIVKAALDLAQNQSQSSSSAIINVRTSSSPLASPSVFELSTSACTNSPALMLIPSVTDSCSAADQFHRLLSLTRDVIDAEIQILKQEESSVSRVNDESRWRNG